MDINGREKGSSIRVDEQKYGLPTKILSIFIILNFYL